MGASKLAGLLVDLELNSAALRTELDAVKAKLAAFGEGVNKTTKASSAASAAASAAAAAAAKAAADAAKASGTAFEAVDKMAKQVKRAANDIAQAGLGLAAVASGAVALAATVDKGIAAEVKNLKNAFTDLAVPIAQLVIPAIRDLADGVRSVADYVAGLSPHTKGMIATFLQVSATVGSVALVVSKVSAAIGALATVIGAIPLAPFVLVLAGVAAIAAATLFLHKVWRENWGGIQEKTRSVVEGIAGYWSDFKAWFSEFIDGLIDKWASVEKAIARAGNVVRSMTPGSGWSMGDIPKANRQSDARIDQWAESLKGGGLGQAALALGKKLKDGFLDATGALKKEFDLIFKDFSLGNGGHATRHGGVEHSTGTGHEGMSDMALQAFEQKLALAADVAAKSRVETERFFSAKIRIAAGERAHEEASFSGRLRSVLDQVSGVLASSVTKVAGKMGAAGEVLNAGIEGFKSGGVWGAVIGVIVDVITKLEGFTKMMDSINAFFGRWISQVSKATAPLFDGIISFCEDIGTLIETITEVTGSFEIIGGVLRGLALIIDTIELSFLYVGKGFLSLFGAKDQKLNDMITKLETDVKAGFDTKVKMPALDATDNRIKKLGDTVQKTSDKFSELLTNMPSGYKVKGAQFRADGSTSGNGGGGGGSGMTTQQQWDRSMGDPTGGVDFSKVFSKDGSLVGFGSGSVGGGYNGPNNGAGSSGFGTATDNATLDDWMGAYEAALAQGMSAADAAAAAWAYVNSHARSSTSSAATAATGGGNTGKHTVAAGGDDGGKVVHIEHLHLAVKNFGDFVDQVTERQTTQAGHRRRNPAKAKK